MRRLSFGRGPGLLAGTNGSIFAHCSSLNQNKLALMGWPPKSFDQPFESQVALLFLLFHKRLCGPLANSRFHHRPDPQHRPESRLEAAYHRADKAIENIVELLAAA